MDVKLIQPYGFCLGVQYVVEQLSKIIEKHSDKSVFCVGQLVHNQNVVKQIKDKGVIILSGDKRKCVETINDGVVVFSAHGTDEKIIQMAKDKGLIVYDLACPFVKKTFGLISNKLNEGFDVIYIGVKNHDESNAAISISDKIHFVSNIDEVNNLIISNEKICVINQTTLSIIDIEDIYQRILEKYPSAQVIDEICNSTRSRQQIIIDGKLESKSLIVVGDQNSNNTMSLYNIAIEKGYDTILIKDVKDLDINWVNKQKSISIMSGASTPKENIEEIYLELKKY